MSSGKFIVNHFVIIGIGVLLSAVIAGVASLVIPSYKLLILLVCLMSVFFYAAYFLKRKRRRVVVPKYDNEKRFMQIANVLYYVYLCIGGAIAFFLALFLGIL